jgi:hypothetical protein
MSGPNFRSRPERLESSGRGEKSWDELCVALPDPKRVSRAFRLWEQQRASAREVSEAVRERWGNVSPGTLRALRRKGDRLNGWAVSAAKCAPASKVTQGELEELHREVSRLGGVRAYCKHHNANENTTRSRLERFGLPYPKAKSGRAPRKSIELACAD